MGISTMLSFLRLLIFFFTVKKYITRGNEFMIDTLLRRPFQRVLVDPVIRRWPFYCVQPYMLTILGGVSGIIAAIMIANGLSWYGVLLLLLSGYFDMLDGSLARAKGMISDVGCILDIIIDRIVEFSIIFAFFLIDPLSRGIVAMMMLGSVLLCITSFLVVGIFTQESENTTKKSFYYSVGLMERSEAFLFFIAMSLFPEYFLKIAWSFTVLVFITALVRIGCFAINSTLTER